MQKAVPGICGGTGKGWSANMPQKNELVALDIIDMAHDGNGVGRLEGMAVFVPASAVGDRLCVRIVKVNRTHCYWRI